MACTLDQPARARVVRTTTTFALGDSDVVCRTPAPTITPTLSLVIDGREAAAKDEQLRMTIEGVGVTVCSPPDTTTCAPAVAAMVAEPTVMTGWECLPQGVGTVAA